IGFVSCKKESATAIPVVSTQQFPDSIFNPVSTFSFISPAGTQSGFPNIDTVYYYLPSTVKVSNKTSLAINYAWYLRRPSMADSLLSTSKDPVFNFSFAIPYGSIVLTSSNSSGTNTLVVPFQLRTAPNGLKITSITIDTMSFINPSTTAFWNGTTGADVFCQMTDGAIMVMDTLNSTGWSSAPSTVAGIYPVKLNLAAAPYIIKYPTGIKSFTISSAISGVSMLDSFALNIYNKNATGPADLIGSVSLVPSSYFGGALPTVIYINNASQNLYLKLNVQWL
ncbi:MAG: hypothetical protein IAF38_13915, partial [Bacteroidia bacterium]|nr:hypothetical protein [Bacteroidia bacterium]